MDAVLYYNLTPNGSGGEHFAPKPNTDRQTWDETYINKLKNLAGAGKYIEMYIHNYSFNEGYFDIDNIGNILLRPTYISIHTDIRTNSGTKSFYAYYFVDRITQIGNGFRLYVSEDLWAGYIADAKFSYIHYKKINFYINDPDVHATYLTTNKLNPKEVEKRYIPLGENYSISDIRIIAVIRFQEQNTFDTTIESINLFSFDPAQLTEVPVQGVTISEMIEGVRNIYGLDMTGTNKAYVTKVYIVHKFFNEPTGTIGFKSVIYSEKRTIQGKNLAGFQSIIEEEFNLLNSNISAPDEKYIPIRAIGQQITVGTKYNGLILPAFVREYAFKIRYEITISGLKISVMDGRESRDITDSFLLDVIANSGTLNALETTAKSLGLISNLAGGAFQIAAGGAGIISGAAQIGNTLASGFTNNSNGTYLPNGTGVTTYDDIVTKRSGYVFYAVYNANYDNSAYKEASYFGAYCDITRSLGTDLFTDIYNSSYLLPGAVIKFTQADIVVDNIPYDAAEAITGEFEQGVKITFI